MRRRTFFLLCGVTAVFMIFVVSYGTVNAQNNSYAEDRALIEDLQARYMFYLDFHDVDKYVMTFTPDGVLDIGTGEIKGHEAIRKIISGMPKEKPSEDAPKLRPATGRHNITNIVIKVDGDKASGCAYWFHYGNNNPERSMTVDSYGHYEDIIVRTNGQWLFSKRKIYNEEIMQWAALKENPCW